jgi:hypothetical protein
MHFIPHTQTLICYSAISDYPFYSSKFFIFEFHVSGMLFSACHALSAMLGLIMLIAPAVLADLDWAVTTMPSLEELCSGKIKLI